MRLLALETSTKHFSIALAEDDHILSMKSLVLDGVLSSSIIPSIEQILKQSQTTIKKIDGFAVGLGPGSFTSLRVGMSTVKALAYATGKPIVGIPSLDAVAWGAKGHLCDEICVMSDARRQLLYSRIYKKVRTGLRPQGECRLLGLEELLDQVSGETLFVGDGVSLYRQEIERRYADAAKIRPTDCRPLFAEEKFWFPRADAIVPLVLPRFEKKKFDDIDKLVPMYLYPEDCQVQRR